MIAIPDLSNMIRETLLYMYSVHVNRFFLKNESFVIDFDGIQSTKSCIRMIFGPQITDLYFEFHSKFQGLELNEHEMAVFFAFALTSLNRKSFKFNCLYRHIYIKKSIRHCNKSNGQKIDIEEK